MTPSVGFTGTRHGMSPFQKETLRKVLIELGNPEFHHGDCIGSDEEAHSIAESLGLKIIIHPPINTSKRAFCKGYEQREPKKYLARNHDIVKETSILIGAPLSSEEELHSGTWATIRYAKNKRRKVILLEREPLEN